MSATKMLERINKILKIFAALTSIECETNLNDVEKASKKEWSWPIY